MRHQFGDRLFLAVGLVVDDCIVTERSIEVWADGDRELDRCSIRELG
jgi:hypothetical protein